jgi:hypothetical protein
MIVAENTDVIDNTTGRQKGLTKRAEADLSTGCLLERMRDAFFIERPVRGEDSDCDCESRQHPHTDQAEP